MKDSKTNIPKGSMCANCTKRFDDCSELDFSVMPIIEETPHLIIVRCVLFQRAEQNGLRQVLNTTDCFGYSVD